MIYLFTQLIYSKRNGFTGQTNCVVEKLSDVEKLITFNEEKEPGVIHWLHGDMLKVRKVESHFKHAHAENRLGVASFIFPATTECLLDGILMSNWLCDF